MSMSIQNIWRTARVIEPIEVTVLGVEGESIESIRAFAVDAAGETGRHFGTNVKVWGNGATVVIHRD